jgi:hypothetical protein
MELGFIGCWGEMHSSSNDLIASDNILNDATRAILDKAFAVVPGERMIAVRAPAAKFQFFGSDALHPIAPVTDAEAFDGSIKSRWGEHEDCLVCGEWNWGTWVSPPDDPFAVRRFLRADNLFVVQGGEGGTPQPPQPPDVDHDGWTSDYDACARVLPALADARWRVMNGGAHANAWFGAAAARWDQEGCLETIAVHLGYRFRLGLATLPVVARAGWRLPVRLVVHNDGWAPPYNPRDVELVLRNRKTMQLARLPINADARRWQPGTTTVSVSPRLPHWVKPGRYDVLLALRDPAPSLRDRPEYAIRLANAGTWDEGCGCNSLQTAVRIVGDHHDGKPHHRPG